MGAGVVVDSGMEVISCAIGTLGVVVDVVDDTTAVV